MHILHLMLLLGICVTSLHAADPKCGAGDIKLFSTLARSEHTAPVTTLSNADKAPQLTAITQTGRNVAIDWDKLPNIKITHRAKKDLNKFLPRLNQETLRKLDKFLTELQEVKTVRAFNPEQAKEHGLRSRHHKDTQIYKIGIKLRLLIDYNDSEILEVGMQ